MQEKQVFEYAVIRVVPKVEREEFMNVGVILFCSKLNFLDLRLHMDKGRLALFAAEEEIEAIEKYLKAFEMICSGNPEGGTIASFTKAERFRWLTAAKSTIIQTSKVHPGLCENAEAALEKLFKQLVL